MSVQYIPKLQDYDLSVLEMTDPLCQSSLHPHTQKQSFRCQRLPQIVPSALMLLELLRENADQLLADSFFPLWLVKASDTIELFLEMFIESFTLFSLRLWALKVSLQ